MGDEGNPAKAATPVTALGAEDRMIAAALQNAVRELQATTAAAMLPLEDGRTLSDVVVVGDPLSIFTMADRHPVEPLSLGGGRGYRTGPGNRQDGQANL
ncbi:hypothetical protein [Streptomyces cellulosae]|uniref:Uncharacterized protein n=1 Tax=Streptomyces cellulosae TaxID=1968 RepID=A0ABW7Y8M6_STRCE